MAARFALSHLSRNLKNNAAAGRRFITSKASGFSSKSTAVPFVFGATLGLGSVLGGLYMTKTFNGGDTSSVFTQSLYAAPRMVSTK